MASKFDKFSSTLASSAPSLADAQSKKLVLQNIIEGDRPEYQYIKIDNIELNPNNDYSETDTNEDIRELAEDIRRNGLLHNIVVSYTPSGVYRLLSGERRLRAYKMLFEETKEPKFASIYALIRKGLTETDEMIILDAANLHVRSGSGDEKKYRKATVRFVNNLKAKFNISDEEAIVLTKQYSSATNAVIDKNIVLERDLHSHLLAFLDNGLISKTQALEYAKLPQEVQEMIASNLESVKNEKVAIFKKKNENMAESAKEIKRLNTTLATQQKELKSVEEEEKEIKKEIINVGNNAPIEYKSELKEKEKQLRQQRKQYTAAVEETKKAINEEVNNINKQAPKKTEKNPISHSDNKPIPENKGKEVADKKNTSPSEANIKTNTTSDDINDGKNGEDISDKNSGEVNSNIGSDTINDTEIIEDVEEYKEESSETKVSPIIDAVRTEFVNQINDISKSVRKFRTIKIEEKTKYISDEDKALFHRTLKKISAEINRLAELIK